MFSKNFIAGQESMTIFCDFQKHNKMQLPEVWYIQFNDGKLKSTQIHKQL